MSYIAYMDTSRSIQKQRRTTLFGYAVLVSLLLFQVGYASHLDEHAIGEKVDSCELCIKLDNQDDTVATVPAEFAPAPRKESLPDAEIDRTGYQCVATYGARAPPSV